MPESIEQVVRAYLSVYLGLLVLLGLTVSLAFVPLGIGNLAVALGIAFVKAGLIAIFFMHLRRDSGLVRLVAIAGLLWLSLLFGLSLADYLTRPNEAIEPHQGSAHTGGARDSKVSAARPSARTRTPLIRVVRPAKGPIRWIAPSPRASTIGAITRR